MDSKIAELINRLSELSNAKCYNTEYYSIHRTLKNIKNRRIVDFLKTSFSSLSKEEYTYLLKDEITTDEEIENFKKFTSPMRYWYLQRVYSHRLDDSTNCREWYKKSFSEENGVLTIYNVDSYLYSVDEEDSQSVIEKESQLCSLEHPRAYLKLTKAFYKFGDEEKAEFYLIKAIKKEYEEYGEIDGMGWMGINLLYKIAGKTKIAQDKLMEYEKKIVELEEKNRILSYHPPQKVECPTCETSIEVIYDSNVEDVKKHFDYLLGQKN